MLAGFSQKKNKNNMCGNFNYLFVKYNVTMQNSPLKWYTTCINKYTYALISEQIKLNLHIPVTSKEEKIEYFKNWNKNNKQQTNEQRKIFQDNI